MAVKPTKQGEHKEVIYNSLRWEQLKDTYEKKQFGLWMRWNAFHLRSLTHGSIARGDVKLGSDVDVFIPEVQNSFIVEISS